MGHSSEYKPEDVVNDFTKPVSKIWDNLMPSSYPHVLEFKTNKVVEVKQKKHVGPYHMTEHFIDADVDVIIDRKPLEDLGSDGKEEIDKVLTAKAYGPEYFYDMRNEMRSLLKYAGLNFYNFDFGGPINAKVNEI